MTNRDKLIDLTDVMVKKLKHLTIVTMAIGQKCIAYEDLQQQLEIEHVRDLEDLIIESIYAGKYGLEWLVAKSITIFVLDWNG